MQEIIAIELAVIIGLLVYILKLVYSLYLLYSNEEEDEEIDKKLKSSKRIHAKIARASFDNPLDPYERFKGKQTNLYEPIHQGGGVKIPINREDN